MNQLPRNQQGVGLIEIMITLLVIAVGILGLVGFQRFAFHSATLAQQRATASELAKSKLEDLRGYGSLAAFDQIGDDVGGSLPAGDDIQRGNTTYSLHWTASAAGLPNLKKITVTVGWTDIDGEGRTLDLSSMIAGINPAASARIYQ